MISCSNVIAILQSVPELHLSDRTFVIPVCNFAMGTLWHQIVLLPCRVFLLCYCLFHYNKSTPENQIFTANFCTSSGDGGTPFPEPSPSCGKKPSPQIPSLLRFVSLFLLIIIIKTDVQSLAIAINYLDLSIFYHFYEVSCFADLPLGSYKRCHVFLTKL